VLAGAADGDDAALLGLKPLRAADIVATLFATLRGAIE
jgi:hypothetical protein